MLTEGLSRRWTGGPANFWMSMQMCCTLTNIEKYQFPHEEIDVFEGWCYLEVIKKHQNEGQKSCLKTMSNFC